MIKIVPRFSLVLAWVFLLVMTTGATAAQQKSRDPVMGIWYTKDQDGGIELYACGGKVCGRFYWLAKDNPGDVSRDTHNPDPEKRDRPLCHLQFMGGFVPDGNGHYTDGWIYSPRSGSTYSAQMTLIDHDTLDLHGYVLSPILGESQTWKRAEKLPPCTTS